VRGEHRRADAPGGPLAFDKAKNIVGQIGQALLEAQKAGIVHRDVSPKNVIVTASGEVRVINFPVAHAGDDKVSGVPAYVSPEQAQGKPVDQRSNTYSLACIFYHLLTGEPPFQAANPQALLELHVSSPPLPPSQRRPEANLSPDIDRVILKALDKNSSRRHLTLRLFLTEVEALNAPGGRRARRGPGDRGVGSPRPCCSRAGRPRWPAWWPRPSPRAPAAGTTPAAAARHDQPRRSAPVRPPRPDSVQAPWPAGQCSIGRHRQHHPGLRRQRRGRGLGPGVTADASSCHAVLAERRRQPGARRGGHPGAHAGGQGPIGGRKSGVKPAFRETLWFKRGDVDQMVADAKAKMATRVGHRRGARGRAPAEDRYVDDGTVTTEDRKKFSLRAGGSRRGVHRPASKLPGAGMSDQEVMEEMAGPRRTMIWVVLASSWPRPSWPSSGS
jgi:hypothetical protein